MRRLLSWVRAHWYLSVALVIVVALALRLYARPLAVPFQVLASLILIGAYLSRPTA